MLQLVQGKVFPFLKDLNSAESNFTRHMKNAVFIIPKPTLLVEAVKTIDDIFEIMERDSQEKGQAFQDIQGDVYEFLLSEIATSGKNGQFRTPRHIIKLMADLVQPKLGQRIADPACGTGGFLLGAYQYIVTQLAIESGEKDLVPDEDGFIRTSVAAGLTRKVQLSLQGSLYGYDIRRHHGASGPDEPNDARYRRAIHRLSGHPEQELHRGSQIRHRAGQPTVYRQYR
nr:N-6 DNA methylase [Pectobacterium colocasium]